MLPLWCAKRAITTNPVIFTTSKFWLVRKMIRNFHQQLLIPVSVNKNLSHNQFCCIPPTNHSYQNNGGGSCAKNVHFFGAPSRYPNWCGGFTRYYGVKASHSSSPVKVKASKKDAVTNKVIVDTNEWETVYRFKHIALAAAIQRIKIYQSVFTCCFVLPGSLGLFIHEVVPQESLIYAGLTSVLACGMLYVMGNFFSHLVGIIYISKKDDTLIRIAHLNFWGKREDQVFSKAEIIPFSELPDNITDIYIKIRFYSEQDRTMKLSLRYGHVCNATEFENIFGSIR